MVEQCCNNIVIMAEQPWVDNIVHWVQHNIVHWVKHNIVHWVQHNIVHWVQHNIVHWVKHNIVHWVKHNIVHACWLLATRDLQVVRFYACRLVRLLEMRVGRACKDAIQLRIYPPPFKPKSIKSNACDFFSSLFFSYRLRQGDQVENLRYAAF